MNIAIIYIGKNKLLYDVSKIFSKELYSKGNIVKEINGILDNVRLTSYQYLVFFIDAGFFLGKNYLQELDDLFKQVGTITAKYASVYTQKRFLSQNTLVKYMQKIESEGLLIHNSDIIGSIKSGINLSKNLEPIKPSE